MDKSKPTGVGAKRPISLAPVKSLSGAAPIDAVKVEAPRAGTRQTELQKPVESAPSVKADAVKIAPSGVEPSKPELKADPPKTQARPGGARPPAKQIKSSASRIPAGKTRLAKPETAKKAGTDPMKTTPAASPAVTAKTTPAPAIMPPAAGAMSPVAELAETSLAKTAAVAKSVRNAAVEAVDAMKPAVAASSLETLAKAVTRSTEIVKAAPKATASAPVSPATTMPTSPTFVSVTGETVLAQTLSMARTFGALQARMLDHACAELKATLNEAETLARSDSAADVVALQAKAVRRSYESYAAHFKELARIAGSPLAKG